MILESSNFPIVRVSIHKGDPIAGFTAFEALLARQQAFALISLEEKDQGEDKPEETHEERKQTALWMKKNKEALRSYVKGMAQIEPSAAKRLSMKAFLPVFSKAWGFPLIIVASDEEAQEAAHQLLTSDQPA